MFVHYLHIVTFYSFLYVATYKLHNKLIKFNKCATYKKRNFQHGHTIQNYIIKNKKGTY